MFDFNHRTSFKELLLIKYQISLSALFIILSNLLLLSFPLTNVLGYEFSAINSFILFIVSGLFTISWNKRAGHYSKIFIAILFVFFLIPLLISVINSFVVEFCSFWDGLTFYLVITSPAILLGFATGLLIVYLTIKLRVILFILLVILISLIPVFDIYFNPQIYFFNPLVGYFPGTVYDEAMSVDFKLIVYRTINIIFSAGIIYLIIIDVKRNKRLRNIIIIIFLIILFYLIKPSFGFSTTYAILVDLLPNKLETEKFIVHTPENFPDNEKKILALHVQYYFETLKESVNIIPQKKIEIFLFENGEQKKEYFGSGAADVAKPWMYQIYLNRDSWSSTLKHEMAHVFSAEFGSTIFKLASSFNPFLIEGFASSQDPFRDDFYIDYLSAMANSEIDASIVLDLISGFKFFHTNSFLTYTYAGSFSKYLIDQYGIEKFKQLYATLDFIKAYGESSEVIVKNYVEFLDNYSFDENIHRLRYYFGRQSITQKICPRYIGRMLNKGWEQVGKKNYEKAKSTFNEILNRTHNYSALIGLTVCFEEQDSIFQSIKLLEKYVEQFDKTPNYYLLNLRLADSYSKQAKIANAEGIYSSLIHQKPTINIELIAQLRNKLLNENLIRDYLTGNDSLKYKILKELNQKEYFYPSFPSLISLAGSTREDYQNFIRQFNKTNFITDFYSAYAVYKLSDYMIINFDFKNARKMAALARRYKEKDHFNILFQESFEKAEWFYYNADEFLQQFISEQYN